VLFGLQNYSQKEVGQEEGNKEDKIT